METITRTLQTLYAKQCQASLLPVQDEACNMEGGDGYESGGGSDVGEEMAHQFSPIFGGEASYFADNLEEAMPYQVPVFPLEHPADVPPVQPLAF